MTLLTPILICLAVAMILGILWLFAPQAALQASISVGVIAALGVSGGIIGELLPRRWFHWDRFPYKTCAWEQNGKVYEKLGIRKWKDKMPDKSRWGGHEYAKTIRGKNDTENTIRLLQETCVAEAVHTASSLLGLLCLRLWPGWGGVIVWAVWFLLGNLPFILIQRYNRPRLLRLRSLLQRREQRKGHHEHTDTDL